MKNSPGWDLLTMQNVSPEKIQRNLRELSNFLNNDVSNILGIVSLYHPLELLKMACWEQRRIEHARPDDIFAQQVSSHLIAYLQALICAKQSWPSSNRQIKDKDWKRLTQLFEDLCRKSVRYVDNFTLQLHSNGLFSHDEHMVAYQALATDFCISPLSDESLLPKQLNALKYRLQPFNALISKVFASQLDGLLAAFASLSENAFQGIARLRDDSTAFKQASMLQLELLKSHGEKVSDMQAAMDRIIREQGWESWVADIVGRRDGFDLFDVMKLTSLSFDDAVLLSAGVGDDAGFLVGDESGWLTKSSVCRDKPFLLFDSHVFCFDGDSLLDRAYEIIRNAVCNHDEDTRKAWQAIENEKQAMVPVTFFTAMLGTMNYTRKVPFADGYVDAVFEDKKGELFIQVPSTHLSLLPSNPFVSVEDTVLQLESEAEALSSLEHAPQNSIVIDMNHPVLYPLELQQGVLTLSFLQLADLASNW
ncbi:MAG: hypothetical protein WC136_10925, partial [Sphaerochaeta sp.]